MITYIGLDLAFIHNGFVVIDEQGSIIYQEVITCPKSIVSDEERLIFLSEKISKLIDEYLPDKICLEGLSFGSKGQSISQMGALHFIIRIFLFKLGIKYKIIAPTQLKKFVTGTGQCKKELMLLKTYKKYNIEFSDNNLCDAYCLARMAMET
jgi:crossover junction endodeoxyribonuclease RuvC